MHSEFKHLRKELMQEQERNAKMQQKVFEMMRMVQQVVLDEAERSARVLGSMSSKFDNFHNRCIPEYTRKSYDLGVCYIIYLFMKDRVLVDAPDRRGGSIPPRISNLHSQFRYRSCETPR